MPDPNLRQYATDRQWEYLEAWERCGSARQAAKDLGCDHANISRAKRNVLVKAAKAGYSPDHDMTHTVPGGYRVKGVSTLYGPDGDVKAQWVKSAEDRERQEEEFREILEAAKSDLPKFPKIKPPKAANESLMACYPVGDHHTGMLSWHEETGHDYDLDIAENLLMGAMEHLIGTIQPCQQSVLAFLGDFLHYDNFDTLTPQNKHLLDADGRYPKMVRTAVRVIREAITFALIRHHTVRVIFEPGNHDPSSSVFMIELLAALYESEPRVEIDTSPARFHYFSFGNTLVGTHHGDKRIKFEQLPLIMATDRPKEWGKSKYRYWWTGHIHHDSVKDINGCRVESFRVLPPVDAWAADSGYRNGREMKAIILHEEFGEVERHTFNPRMLREEKNTNK